MSVRIGKLEPERRGEGSHVEPIALSRFVPSVMFDLKLGGQAGDGSADETSVSEPLHWVWAVSSVRRGVALPADPVLIECHRVDVNLAQIRVPQDCAGWPVVLDEPEAQRLESVEQILEPVAYNHDVHVLVLSRLSPEKRVNSPPAVQPYLKPGGLKGIQYRKHLLGEHVTVLALYRVAASPNAGSVSVNDRHFREPRRCASSMPTEKLRPTGPTPLMEGD